MGRKAGSLRGAGRGPGGIAEGGGEGVTEGSGKEGWKVELLRGPGEKGAGIAEGSGKKGRITKAAGRDL